MNPNQRGVELPPGCKDLMDVLKMQPVAEGWIDAENVWGPKKARKKAAGKPGIEWGKVKDIEARVKVFLDQKNSPRFLGIVDPPRHIFLTLVCANCKLELKLFVYEGQPAVKRALRRIFQNDKLCRANLLQEFVSQAVSGSAVELANMLTELLIEGYGIQAEAGLIFHPFGGSGAVLE